MDTRKNINIWKTLQKVPAGTMFVPLIIGAIITTVCQGFFKFDLWNTLGNPMKDMFSSTGQMLIIGLMLFCTGTQLKISDMKDALRRGVLLILVRLGIAYLLCALFYMTVFSVFRFWPLCARSQVLMRHFIWALSPRSVIKQIRQVLE